MLKIQIGQSGAAWLGHTGSKVPSCSVPVLFLFFEGSHVCPVIKACGVKVCELDWLIHFENEHICSALMLNIVRWQRHKPCMYMSPYCDLFYHAVGFPRQSFFPALLLIILKAAGTASSVVVLVVVG